MHGNNPSQTGSLSKYNGPNNPHDQYGNKYFRAAQQRGVNSEYSSFPSNSSVLTCFIVLWGLLRSLYGIIHKTISAKSAQVIKYITDFE